MAMKEEKSERQQLNHYGKNTVLLLALTGLLVLYPALEENALSGWVALLFSTFAVLGAYFILADKPKKTLYTGMLLSLPMLLFGWLPVLQHEGLHLLAGVSNLAFYCFITYHVIRSVLSAPRVTGDVVAGSIVVYMLLGITWAMIYQAIHALIPGSFYVSDAITLNNALTRPDFLYYSFVTLSTLGYGDIVPVGGLARSMAALEAMTGVIYIAVFVGRIISMHKPMERQV